jgi:hypothetical protein
VKIPGYYCTTNNYSTFIENGCYFDELPRFVISKVKPDAEETHTNLM